MREFWRGYNLGENEVIVLIIFEHSFFLKLCLSEICQGFLSLDQIKEINRWLTL